jgi:hypothetical protein
VRCWFDAEDMKIALRTATPSMNAIRLRDKVLLVLSEAAIASTWVEGEVKGVRGGAEPAGADGRPLSTSRNTGYPTCTEPRSGTYEVTIRRRISAQMPKKAAPKMRKG